MATKLEVGREGRLVWPAMKRGLRNRCPSCGSGKLFGSFLTVHPTCSHCHEQLDHHRADDFPAYVVIVIVGHIVVTALMIVEARFDLSLFTHLAIWLPLTLVLTLLMLQPVKGAVIGLQWALRMHGFGDGKGGDK